MATLIIIKSTVTVGVTKNILVTMLIYSLPLCLECRRSWV